MFNSKYNTLLTVLLIVAIIAIIGLLGYLGYSVFNSFYIEAETKNVVDAFENLVAKDNNTIINPSEEIPNENVIIGGVEDGESMYSGGSESESGSSTGTVTYNGYTVIGTISIPTIKIEYPILEKVTTRALKIGVCYLSGAGVNQVGNTVFQAHNYRNGKMFSNLSNLVNGDDIYLTDSAGNKIQYKVYRTFEAKATDGSFFNRDTEGKREITLSTCTEDATTRTIVFAREV